MTVKMLVFNSETPSLGKNPSERSMEERFRYGIICIDKPQGPSSHETAAFVRKILRLEKTGHTGTLDQNVSGVLVVLLEQACKAATFMMGSTKEYVCIMRLEREIPKAALDAAALHFRGKIYQTPPMASAVRKQLRIREIYSFEILQAKGKDVLFKATTDAGTYVRKLVSDMGEVLSVKAEMLELRRTRASSYSETGCITLQKLSDYYWLWKEKGDESNLKSSIISIEDAASTLKKAILTDYGAQKVSLGAKPRVAHLASIGADIKKGDYVALFTGKGELVCIAVATRSSLEAYSSRANVEFEWAKIMRVVQEFQPAPQSN